MKNYPLEEIQQPFFTKAVYLDPQFIVTAPEIPITEELKKTLANWGFAEVYSDGEPSDGYTDQQIQTNKEATSVIGDTSAISDLDRIQKAELFYNNFQKYVKTLFAFLSIRNELDFNTVAEKIKEACNFVRDNRRYLMRTKWLSHHIQDENQLVSHTVRSTIIAIIIGTTLKIQPHRLIELGVAALLHEIGMIKLPQDGYQKNQVLTEQEKKLLYAHPILGFNLLKSFNFPLVVSLAALEHHERENGTGYPQRKTGEKISQYAKIIAVACSYEAIMSRRPHKGAKDSHTGIMELLKNDGKQYDDDIVRALVFSLSIYPIGLYVLLSNGKKGQVVDVNPYDPRHPIVQVFGDLMPNGKNKTMRTSPEGCSIIRPLTHEEIENN